MRVIKFNRPDRLNAWNDELFDDFREALADAEQDPGTACIVVGGEGRVFSAGADMADLGSTDKPKAPVPPDQTAFGKSLRQTTSFSKPMIAAVHGVGVGWGMTILGHCDFVFMAEDARLRTPFTQLGLTAEAGSSITFAQKMGWQNAAHVLMTSRFISAEEAKELGMVFRVTPPDSLMEEALEYAAEIASQPIASLIATKKLMLSGGLSGQSREERVMEAHRREMAAFANGLTGGPANREAIRAFREKRKPDFSRL